MRALWQGAQFLVGVVIGLAVALPGLQYKLLELSPQVTMGNIIQGTATVLTGLIVASFIQRNTQADRKEKDLLLGHLDSVLAMLREFEKFK